MTPQQFGYTSAKFGVVGFTQSFEMSNPYVPTTEGIKVYALCPDTTDTALFRSFADITEDFTTDQLNKMLPAEFKVK